MRNLIPVKRMDKNGVLNTKWVKQDDPSSSPLSAPAPQLPAKESQLLSGALNIDTEHSGISIEEARAKARKLPVETSAALLEMMDQNSFTYTTQVVIVCALHNDDSTDTLENISAVFSEYVYQELSWQVGSHEAYEAVMGDIRGMKKYPQFADVDNLYRADETTRHQASKIPLLHYEADKEGHLSVEATDDGDAHYINSPEVAKAVIDQLDTPERADDILEAIYEKGFDPEFLAVSLDTSQPLRDGAL